MAADSTEIVNLALSRLGENTVPSIDDNSKDAQVMKALYEGTVYEILSIMPWNCAVKRAVLPLSTNPNLTKYSNSYDLPADLIRVLDIDGEKEKIYRIEGQQIFTDEGEGDPLTITIRYISKLDDVTLWDELLQETIVLRLAEKASLRITSNLQLTSYIQQQVITLLTIAQQSANMEDREDITNIIASLNNSKLADILLAKNNYAAG